MCLRQNCRKNCKKCQRTKTRKILKLQAELYFYFFIFRKFYKNPRRNGRKNYLNFPKLRYRDSFCFCPWLFHTKIAWIFSCNWWHYALKFWNNLIHLYPLKKLLKFLGSAENLSSPSAPYLEVYKKFQPINFRALSKTLSPLIIPWHTPHA